MFVYTIDFIIIYTAKAQLGAINVHKFDFL